jgi:hypothetical protein
MGKNQSASGLTNIVQYDTAGNISLVSGSTTLLFISSSGAITTTGVISGSNALSASYAVSASNALAAQTASFVANAESASNAVAAQTASYASAFTVASTLTAQTLVVQTITSSVDFVTGSTRFGSILENTHQFTGSMLVTGSIGINLSSSAYLTGSLTVQSMVSASTSGPVVAVRTSYINKKIIAELAEYSSDGVLVLRHALASTPTVFITSQTGGTSHTYFNHDGNVGIGTSSPINKLDIRISSSATYSSSSTGSALTLYNTSATTNGFVGIDFIAEPTSGNTGRAAINMIVTGNGTSDLAFSTRNTDMGEKMRITSGGNIGIGTSDIVSTNLTGAVTIRKSYEGDTPNGTTTQTYYQNQSPLFLFGRNSGISIISNNGDEGEIIFGNNSTRAYARISTSTGTSSVGGDMYFKVGSDTERMRITSDGAMYMSRIGSDLTFADSVGGMYVRNNGNAAGTEEELRIFGRNIGFFSHSGTRYATIASSGNVGIYTSTPSARLEIKMGGDGDMLIGRYSGGSAKLLYAYQSGADGFLELRTGADSTITKLSGYSGTPSYFLSNVLVGQTTGDLGQNGWQLQAAGGGHTSFAINNNEAFIFNNRNTGTTYEIDFRTNVIERGKISVTDSGVSYATQPSDRNLKKNFEDWNQNVLDVFKNLNPQKFNFLVEDDSQPKTKGFIAQDLVESFPEAYPISKDRYFFNPSGMVVYMMKAIQELKAENDTLKEILQRNNIQ